MFCVGEVATRAKKRSWQKASKYQALRLQGSSKACSPDPIRIGIVRSVQYWSSVRWSSECGRVTRSRVPHEVEVISVVRGLGGVSSPIFCLFDFGEL